MVDSLWFLSKPEENFIVSKDDGYLFESISSVDPSLFWVLPLDTFWTQVYRSRRGYVTGVFLFCDFEDDGYLVKPTSSVDNPSLFWVLPLDFVWTQVYWSRRGSVADVFHGTEMETIWISLYSQKQLDTHNLHIRCADSAR